MVVHGSLHTFVAERRSGTRRGPNRTCAAMLKILWHIGSFQHFIVEDFGFALRKEAVLGIEVYTPHFELVGKFRATRSSQALSVRQARGCVRVAASLDFRRWTDFVEKLPGWLLANRMVDLQPRIGRQPSAAACAQQ